MLLRRHPLLVIGRYQYASPGGAPKSIPCISAFVARAVLRQLNGPLLAWCVSAPIAHSRAARENVLPSAAPPPAPVRSPRPPMRPLRGPAGFPTPSAG
jgi:hypothetical protein